MISRMRMMVALLVSVAFSTPVLAGEALLDPLADNWISSCSSGCTVNNGDMSEIRVRTAWWGAPGDREPKNFHSLLQFDLTELTDVAIRIQTATLGLYYYVSPHNDPVGRRHDVHRVMSIWDEMTSTWQLRGDDMRDPAYWDTFLNGEPPYQPGGGDCDPNVAAWTLVPASTNEWMIWDVTSLVDVWVSGEYPNLGLIIVDADEIEGDPGGGTVSYLTRFHSREYSNPEYRPYLYIDYAVLGDLNCDGVLDFGDINPFVLALSDPEGYAEAYPGCDPLNGDCNRDGEFDFGDINPFVALLGG